MSPRPSPRSRGTVTSGRSPSTSSSWRGSRTRLTSWARTSSSSTRGGPCMATGGGRRSGGGAPAWLPGGAPLRARPAGRGVIMDPRPLPTQSASPLPGRPEPQTNLADILERVLDKGIVIAGDIQINLLDIELLTVKLRLLIASVERAREMGINWWETDPSLQSLGPGEDSDNRLERENKELRERLERVERQLGVGDG